MKGKAELRSVIEYGMRTYVVRGPWSVLVPTRPVDYQIPCYDENYEQVGAADHVADNLRLREEKLTLMRWNSLMIQSGNKQHAMNKLTNRSTRKAELDWSPKLYPDFINMVSTRKSRLSRA